MWFKKRKLRRQVEQRKSEYIELNGKFKIEHNFIVRSAFNSGINLYSPKTKEDEKYLHRIRNFF